MRDAGEDRLTMAALRKMVPRYFAKAERFFDRPGVRRALVACWADALADLRERNAKSMYARYHSYDAVSQLLEYKRERDRVLMNGLSSLTETIS